MAEGLFRNVLSLVLGFSGGFLFSFICLLSVPKIGHLAYQRSYHFHHSLLGLAVFFLIPFFWGDSGRVIFIASFGLGLIVEHGLREGLVFISKS